MLEALPEPAALAALREAGVDADEGEPLVVARELARAGRSSARINGGPVAGGQLRELGEAILDFVGQHEQQRLLAPAYHLELVDRFGGALLAESRERVAALHARHAALVAELKELLSEDGRLVAESDFAAFARDEIASVAPQPGEDERLRERRDDLTNVERIAAAVRAAHDSLAREGGADVDCARLGVGDAGRGRALRRRARRHPAQALGALQGEKLNEIAIRLARALEATEFEPEQLDATANASPRSSG